MPNQLQSPFPENSTSRGSFFISKPKHNTRHLMVANQIRDVIGDHNKLERDKHKAKFVKREMLPPLTAAYRQGRDIREVVKVQAQLRKEVAKCEEGELERQRLLEEVLGKCETLKTMFRESEVAYAELEEEMNSHQQVIEAATKEKKYHKMEMKGYLKAGESLMELWEIMQDVIVENKCYYDFMEQVSDGSGIQAIGHLIDRFENNISTKNMLCQQLNEAVDRAETIKTDLLKNKEDWEQELAFELEELQKIQHETSFVNTMNAKYEKALNNISVDSVAHAMELNGMLKSAEQMIENLIRRKVIGKSYRKKTLAQQFEMIREDYVKRKAIVHEYEKAKEIVERKKSRRLALYEEFSKRHVISNVHSQRLDDLYEKMKMKATKKKHDRYIKMKKRMESEAVDNKEEVYAPLADKRNILQLDKRRKFSSITEEEDLNDTDEELDAIDLSKYSDLNEFDTALNNEKTILDRFSFMSTSTAFSTTSVHQPASTSRGYVGSIFSAGSGGSSQSMSIWGSSQSFIKTKRQPSLF